MNKKTLFSLQAALLIGKCMLAGLIVFCIIVYFMAQPAAIDGVSKTIVTLQDLNGAFHIGVITWIVTAAILLNQRGYSIE